MNLIDPDKTLPELIADRAEVQNAIDVLRALQSLELVVTVNGVKQRCPIQFGNDSALIEVNISTA